MSAQPSIAVAPPVAEEGPAPARGRRRVILLVAPVIVIALAFAAWKTLFAAHVPANIVVLSGRIEGDDSTVAPKTSGRIAEVRVREGDSVNAGDVLARLDDSQIRARQEQARVAVAGAEARQTASEAQLAVLQAQLGQSELQAGQSKVDAAGRVAQAEADLSAIEADLAQQQAAYRLAAFDRDAYAHLAESGSVSERQAREAASNADRQAAAVTAAQRRVDAARGGLTIARANLTNEAIRDAQSLTIQKQIAQQRAEIASTIASAQQAHAELTEAEANLRDLTVTAPFNGTVITRAAEPGEVVTAGTAIVTLLNLRQVYLRGYVPEGAIGKVRVGDAARVYLDSNPGRAFDAYVSRIDPAATFTPENTYFRDDRVKQAVGVKLQFKDAGGLAKPGMPADAEILTGGGQWPRGWRHK
ncbi:MAG TPA: efflux RND transporter periplasmic adaptor subunit [Thermoanaerobaculia bacterium]|nr:efflux RND transporter periplasmic adaptor subunit [Thermoanaerobaculia bacterium]